jgi:hypothetical protein
MKWNENCKTITVWYKVNKIKIKLYDMIKHGHGWMEENILKLIKANSIFYTFVKHGNIQQIKLTVDSVWFSWWKKIERSKHGTP